jgi:hypothetical protein
MPKIDLFLNDFPELKEIPKPTWKHRYFYNFLEISPSYFQIYLYKNKQISLQKMKQIEQYEKVLETYDLVGDIYNISFEDWWKKTGYKLFDPVQKFEALFKIDLRKSLAYNQQLLKMVYQDKKSKLLVYLTPISFEKNKIQELVLSRRLELIDTLIDRYGIRESEEYSLGKKLPKWFIGYQKKGELFGKTSAASFGEIRPAIKFEKSSIGYFPTKITKKQLAAKKRMNLLKERPYLKPVDIKNTTSKNAHKAKRYLSMLMSKHKNEALVLSENAARGIFPSKEKILKKYQDFDFSNLRNAPEFQPTNPKNDFLLNIKNLQVTGSNSRTKRKHYEELQKNQEIEHRMLEKVDTDLKETIKEKALAIYTKEYKKIVIDAQKASKPTLRRS